MKNILLAVTISLSFYGSVVFSNSLSTTDRVKEINLKSLEYFDISLPALTYLMHTSRDKYVRKSQLEKSGELSLLSELEKSDLVKIKTHIGLPNGDEPEVAFLQIIPINRSVSIIRAFNSLTGKTRDIDSEIASLENELKELLEIEERKIKEAELEELNANDMNKDGKRDIFYESDEFNYYQLIDRNFDGKVDEKWKYDLNDVLISGISDDDFNGIFESRVFVTNGSVSKIFIDTDNNGVSDVFHSVRFGITIYSEKYYPAVNGNQAKIARIERDIREISGKLEYSNTTLSEEAFYKDRVK